MPSVYSSADGSTAEEVAQAWGARVAANRAQAERVREEGDGGDHYRAFASRFRADPHRTDDETLAALLHLAQPEDTWVDVGAGAGRFALPLALQVERVIAVEPSAGMRAELAAVQLEHGIANVAVRNQRWPSNDPDLSDIADVALISHVAYDIEPIAAFLDTLERAARRECVALLYDQSPGSLFWQLWPAVHGEAQALLPGGAEFVALLEARGALVAVQAVGSAGRQRFRFDDFESALSWAQRRLWLADGSARLPALREALAALLIHEDGEDGRWTVPDQPTQMLIRWRPWRQT